MFREETLQQTGRREYEEPDGEFLELVESSSNSITVLTRVDSDKGGGETAPFDPSEYSVSELKEELNGEIADPAIIAALLEAEKDGKDRKTAVQFLESYQ